MRVRPELFLLTVIACTGGSKRPPPLADLEGSAGADGSGGGSGGAAGAAIPAAGTSTVISVSADASVEVEPHLAVAPDGRIAVIWIDLVIGEPWYLGYALSPDGGTTWSTPAKLESPFGARAADPSIVADETGAFHAAWLAYPAGQKSSARVYTATLAAGATTFGAADEITDAAMPAEYDKPWITLTPGGAKLVSYTRPGGGIAVARSSSVGAWTRASIVPDGTQAELSSPCVSSPGGHIYVTYLEPGGVKLRASDDDGSSWPSASVTTVSEPADGTPPLDQPTCVASGDDIWIGYGVTKQGSGVDSASLLTAIRVAHSADRGKSIAGRVSAHDTTAGASYLHPGLARDDDGTLHVLYYAGSAQTGTGSLRHARANGNGPFGPSAIARAPLGFTSSRTSARWPGDYLGLTVRDGAVRAAFADTSGDGSHIAFHFSSGDAPP